MKKITLFFMMLFMTAFTWQGMAQSTIHITTSGGSYATEKWVSITTEVDGAGTQIWGQGDGTYGNASGLLDMEAVDLAPGTYYVNCYDKYSDGWDGTMISVTAYGNVIGDNGGVSPSDPLTNDSSTSWDTPADELEASFEVIVPNPPPCPDAAALMGTAYANGDYVMSWSVEANAGGYNWEIQPQGTAQGDAAILDSGVVTSNTATTSTLVDGTDYTLYVQTDCTTNSDGTGSYSSLDFTFEMPIANNEMADASPIMPSDEGTGCSSDTFDAWTGADIVTKSDVTPGCYDYAGLDVFFSWTATSAYLVWNDGTGNPGIAIYNTSGEEIDCIGTYASTDSILKGWAVGDELIIQIYDYGTTVIGVGFCLEKKAFINPIFTTSSASCDETDGYSMNVDVSDLGGASSVTISDDQGSDVQPLTAAGTVTFGPFPLGTVVSYTVTSDDDSAFTATDSASVSNCPQSYDNFAGALPLTVGAGCSNTLATTVGATASGDNTATCGSTDGTEGDVWFSFVAPVDGNVIVTTSVGTGDNLDTVMELYSYDGTDLAPVICNDDGSGISPFSQITVSDNSLTPGDTYYVSIHEYNGDNEDDFNICASLIPPVNDDACDAIAIVVGATSDGDSFTDSGATAQMDEPFGSCFNGGIQGSTWYSFVAPTSGAVNVTTDIAGGTHTDTELAIYEVATCGDFTTYTELACDQDGGDTVNYNSTAFAHSLVAGDTYYVQVDRWSSNAGGTFGVEVHEVTTFNPVFTATIVADCANDEYSVDVEVTNLGGATSVEVTDGTTVNASAGLGVITYGPYVDGTEVTFNVTSEDDVTFTSSETVQYYCPPANDFAVDAIAVVCDATVTGDTSMGATNDMRGDCGDVDNDSPNMWYSYTGSSNDETITASLCGTTDFDTSIGIYTGTPGALVCYAQNDDSCDAASEISFHSDGAQTYYIMVEGYDVGSVGAFSLEITCGVYNAPAVANQDCASALAVVVNGPVIDSDNSYATTNIDNPSCDAWGTIADVWFSFVASDSGVTQIITTLDTATEVNLAVYDACGVVAMSCMDTSDTANTISYVAGDLTDGATYYVQAWNAGTGEEGTFSIEVTNENILVPDCVTQVFPANGATDVTMRTDITWGAATTGDPATSYDFYYGFGTDAATTFWQNTTDTFLNGILLTNFDSTVFNWKVVARNAAGEAVGCTESSFTTVAAYDDYDGDGVINSDEVSGEATDTDMTNPCDPAQTAGYTGYDPTNTMWAAADCDGDGELNEYEDTNGSDPYDADDTVAAVNELQAVGFEYYPNPVSNSLTVKANETITSVVIFNTLGQVVKQANPSSLNAQIDMSTLANGTYFIKATVNDKVGTYKVVKK